MSAPIQYVNMMIKIQINLSLPEDGSFVAHSMIMRIQKIVPTNANGSKIKSTIDRSIGHPSRTEEYKPGNLLASVTRALGRIVRNLES